MIIKAMFLQVFFAILITVSISCHKQVPDQEQEVIKNAPAVSDIYAAKMNQRLVRTVNLGNALEAPHEGDWGMIIKKSYIDSIAAAGFTAVRIPIKWSAHAEAAPPYNVNSAFFNRIDEVVGWCLEADLNLIIDFHHYDGLMTDPEKHKDRWLGIWKQISQHYKDAPDNVFFELLNEPHDALTADLWNHYLKKAVTLIRKDNPTRMIIAGPVHWNSFDQLKTLSLPPDTMMIATFHYYLPFHFTHQGANWVEGSDAWLGTTWRGTTDEKKTIEDNFTVAVNWGKTFNRPLFLGEFGAYSKADSLSRIMWTTFVRQTAEKYHISWAYWEFGAGFGIYDRENNRWRKGLLHALIP